MFLLQSDFPQLLKLFQVTWNSHLNTQETCRSVSVAHVFSIDFPVPYESTHRNTKIKIVFMLYISSNFRIWNFCFDLIFFIFFESTCYTYQTLAYLWHVLSIQTTFSFFPLSLFFCLSICINMHNCVCLSSVHFNIIVYCSCNNQITLVKN